MWNQGFVLEEFDIFRELVCTRRENRSNFWKTSDDKFIIKSLVNAWNVADLYVPNSRILFYFFRFIKPRSKITLRDGLKSDTEFLSKGNIMDYSYVYLCTLLYKMKFRPSLLILVCCLGSMKRRNR